MEGVEYTSGASGRIIPVFRNLRQAVFSRHSLRRALFLVQSVFVWLFFLFRLRLVWLLSVFQCRDGRVCASPKQGGSSRRRKAAFREEEAVLRRRILAESVEMVVGDAGVATCEWSTSIFVNARCNSLFVRSWMPSSGEMRAIIIIIHGLNEHGGRYAHFAAQLTSCNFGVYAVDWIGHGGSDGLHGYVPSLDHVVADIKSFLAKVKMENPSTPCFLFGHSTGGAVVLKAASYPDVEDMLEGIILTSPALRVRPAHPIVGVVAPLFSVVLPKYQFKGANKRGIPVSRDPAALVAKYSDPLVYTGPIRVRTGHEILKITAHLQQNMKNITVPFFVLHGTADTVTDPLASKDLYNKAASTVKDIKLYDGFLHDLLFEPEKDEIAADIIGWMNNRLQSRSFDW
ncbi:uncharacterized protein LOC116256323 [Nymphaea colorata]|nr:uncharacterized protein LOC116256323 [Nymphaea colorata]